MMNIRIPQPCTENWNKMSPEAQGRFCGKCCKVVIDFTGKSPEEIRDMLSARAGERVCGRVRNSDLAASPRRSRLHFSLVRFAAALYLVFGSMLFMSSCTTQGEIVPDKIDTTSDSLPVKDPNGPQPAPEQQEQ